MSRLSKLKDRLGRLGGNDPGQAPAKVAQTATINPPIEAETTIISDTTGTFSEMTPEQIIARNRAILAQVSHNPPVHKSFMEGAKSVWRVVGPIAFIVFTAGEVYYYIERAVEAKRAGREVPDKDTPGAIGMWVVMALINIAGQMAFLFFITKAGSFDRDWPVYGFIAFRVIGVIVGDAYVAFFLSPSPIKVEHIVKHQKAQGEGFDQLNDASMERKLKESRAQLQLEQNQRTIDRERSDATFIDQFHEMNTQAILQQQARLLEIKAPEKDI